MKIEGIKDLLVMYQMEVKEVEKACDISSIEDDPDLFAPTITLLLTKFAFSKYEDKFEKVCLDVIDEDPELVGDMHEVMKEQVRIILRSMFAVFSKRPLLDTFEVITGVYQSSDKIRDFIETVYDESTNED